MKKSEQAFVGIDIGTTSLAAVVVDRRGAVLKTFSAPNPSACDLSDDGRHEQDANAILRAVDAVLADCESFARAAKMKVIEIGWTGQMHGVVAVDRRLRPLTPFVTWRDRRCAPPLLSCGVMDDWKRRKVKGIHRVLTIPGYVIARRTGRCVVDATFRASMGKAENLVRFAKWLPETDDSQMIGDNQAGVYAAVRLKPGAAVVNLGTSGQLSVVVDGDGSSRIAGPEAEARPFPGGKTLVCRASHVGGAALAKLRKTLGISWDRLNAEAESDPRIAARIAEIVDDLVKGVNVKGIRAVVGVGNALRLNPCLQRAIERRLKVKCVVPEVEEMAAWGAALYVLDRRATRLEGIGSKRSTIVETLRREIALGKYAVNEKFPSEQMLVRRFKVARATVSHALDELKQAGLLRVKIGSGAYVTPLARGRGAIGLIVPGQGRGTIFEPICRAIENEVGKLGYSVISCGMPEGDAEARKAAALAFANECVAKRVDGVIMEPIESVSGRKGATQEILSLLREKGIQVMLVEFKQ